MQEIRYGREDDLYSEAGHPWNNADRMIFEGINVNDPGWRSFPAFIDNTATIDVDKVMKGTDDWLKDLGYVREGLYYRNIRPDDKQYLSFLTMTDIFGGKHGKIDRFDGRR